MPAIDILAMMSMGPALIGEEIYDSVDLIPGDMFNHIAVGDDVFSFRDGYTLSSLCSIRALPSDVEKWRRHVSHNLRMRCVRIPAALYPWRLTKVRKPLPSDCSSHSQKLTNAKELQCKLFRIFQVHARAIGQ